MPFSAARKDVSDSGATICLTSKTSDLLPDSQRTIPPRRVQQADGYFSVSLCGLKEKFYPHPNNPKIGIGVIMPLLIYPQFRSDVGIVSTVQLQLLRVHSVYPPLTHGGSPYFYKLHSPLSASDPHDAHELEGQTTFVLGAKDGFLTVFRSYDKESFDSLISIHDGKVYNRDRALQRFLHQLYRHTGDLHMRQFPAHMQTFTQQTMDILTASYEPKPQVYQTMSNYNLTCSVSSTERPLRAGLVGPGLCQEATSEFRKCFSDKFEIVAVWEVAEYGLAADEHARHSFPRALHLGSIRDLVISGSSSLSSFAISWRFSRNSTVRK